MVDPGNIAQEGVGPDTHGVHARDVRCVVSRPVNGSRAAPPLGWLAGSIIAARVTGTRVQLLTDVRSKFEGCVRDRVGQRLAARRPR